MKIAPRVLHVVRDLLAEGFDGGKLLLVAEAPREAELDLHFPDRADR